MTRIPREMRLWFNATGLFWVAVLYPVFAWLWAGVLVQSTEVQIESTGQVLQILALLGIAIGLNALRRGLRDDRQGFGDEVVSSLTRLKRIIVPPKRRDFVGDLDGAEKGLDGLSALLFTTPEARMAMLEEEVKAGHARIIALEGQYDSLVSDLSQNVEEIKKSIKEQYVIPYLNSVPTELVSVLWLIVGTMMVWFPERIADISGIG